MGARVTLYLSHFQLAETMSNTASLREKHCSVAEQCRLKGDPIKKEAPIKALEVRRDEQHRHHPSLTSEVLSARDSLTPCSL